MLSRPNGRWAPLPRWGSSPCCSPSGASTTMWPRLRRRSTSRDSPAGGRRSGTSSAEIPRASTWMASVAPSQPRPHGRRGSAGREFQRRRGGASVLVPGAWSAGDLRLQGGQHARQHDWPPLGPLSGLRLGRRAARRCRESGAGTARRVADRDRGHGHAWRQIHGIVEPRGGPAEGPIAGALDLSLAGPRRYGGEPVEDAWIGEGSDDAGADDIRRALGLFVVACLVEAALIGAAVLLRNA